jgi:hypothetical protein
MKQSVLTIAVGAYVLGALGTATARAQHADDVWVGVTSNGVLTISPDGFVPDENYHTLTPVDGLLKGWADDDPGFDHLVNPQPENNVFPLASGAQIWLEVVAIDPAFRLIDQGFQVLDEPGEDTLLGDHTLHIHNTWHINNQDPEFDPDQCVWHGTFLLRDDGSTGYATSAPLTFSFTNVVLEDLNGDFNDDGTVDLDDYAALVVCLDGPGVIPNPDDPGITTCEVECLNAFDFDHDRDVDLRDVAEFQQVFEE